MEDYRDKVVVVNTVPKNFERVSDKLVQSEDFNLFAVLKMDDVSDRWSVLISGRDLDEDSKRRTLYPRIFDVLEQELEPDESEQVARIGVFPASDHLIGELLSRGEGEVNNAKVNGNYIHEGRIFIARQDTPKATLFNGTEAGV